MMVISGDFTSIVAGNTQSKVENRKPQQSEQASKTQFDDVLNKSKDDNLRALNDSQRQAIKAESEKKYSDKTANDKAVDDRALSNKQANDKAASNNAELAAASENRIPAKDHDSKKEEKLKSSSQEEQNSSDDRAASSINHYLSQLNSVNASTKKEGGQGTLHNKSDENGEGIESDGVDGKNNSPLNSQLLSVKEKMDKLTTVGNAAIGQSGDDKIAGFDNEATEAKELAQGQLTPIDKNKVKSAATDSDSHSIEGKDVKDAKTQSTANGEVADARLKGVDLALQKESSGATSSLINGADNNSRSDQLAGAAKEKAQDKVKASDKDSAGENDTKNRTGFAELKEGDVRDIKTDDDKSADALSGRKQTSGRRVQNSVNQTANNANQQTNANIASDKLQAAPMLNVGDRVAATGNGTERRDVLGRIADVEVTENRKVGEMRVLRIKLNPEDLGMVEARLRKTSDGLQIEIHADRQETARLLAADRHMLGKALEKSGLNDDGHLTIMIVDRSSQTVQQGQASNSGQSTSQDNSGQNFNGQRQFSGQQGQGGHNESRQTFTEFPFTGTPLQEENVGQEAVYRNPRHLVV